MINFRWVTSACMLDYSTVVIGDKFGSISVIRLPKDTNEDTQVHFYTYVYENISDSTILG